MHTFEVLGETAFPVEMLQLDSCCPETPLDATRMRQAMRGPARQTSIRMVTLNDQQAWKPNESAWAAKGWHCRYLSTDPIPPITVTYLDRS
jgi:hypothetical protein